MPDFSDRDHVHISTQLFALNNELGAVQRPADPYVPCWCRSGKKWKFCHKDRDKQVPKPAAQIQAELFKIYRSGPCQHPLASADTCSESEAIKSHTVQRGGGLTKIAEQGQVNSFKKAFTDLDLVKKNGQISAKKVYIAAASIFPGFCNFHDTAMFKRPEAPNAILDKWNAFLLSFRALAYESFTKEVTLKYSEKSRHETDYGMPFSQQVGFQILHLNFLQGLHTGVAKMALWKKNYDEMYLENDLSNFRVYGVIFNEILPFVSCGALMPEFDFQTNLLQELWKPDGIEQICFNVTTLGDCTVAILGWIGSDNGPAARFVDSFASLPDVEKADAALYLAFEYLENTYTRPSWWNALAPYTQKTLDDKIAGGADLKGRSPSALQVPADRILNIEVKSILDNRSCI
jgi:hypothetical protein